MSDEEPSTQPKNKKAKAKGEIHRGRKKNDIFVHIANANKKIQEQREILANAHKNNLKQEDRVKARNVISAQVSRIYKRMEPGHLTKLAEYKDKNFLKLIQFIASRESPEGKAEYLQFITSLDQVDLKTHEETEAIAGLLKPGGPSQPRQIEQPAKVE